MMEKNLEIIDGYLRELLSEYDRAALVVKTGKNNSFYGYVEIHRGIDISYQLETGGETVTEVIREIANLIKIS